MVNMNVAWAGPNPSLAKLAGELNARFGLPARFYEYVTGYKSASNITSHNADAYGRGHGMDIFVGAGHNISVEQGIDLAERLRQEGKRGSIPGHPDRLAYIIHRGRICGDHTGWEWVAYNGVADHYDHIHISSVFDYYWGDVVAGNPADYNSTAAWNLWAATTQADSIEPIQEDDLANVPQADWDNIKLQIKSLVDNVATKTTIKEASADLPRAVWAYKNPGLGGADAYQILRDAVASNTKLATEVAAYAAKAATGGATEEQIRKAVLDGLAAGVKVDVTVGGSE